MLGRRKISEIPIECLELNLVCAVKNYFDYSDDWNYCRLLEVNYAGKIPEGEVNPRILDMAESTVLEYERYMYNHEFHRISYLLDDCIRAINKHWVNNVKLADSKGDVELRKQIVVDCFYACKVMAILVHPIAPEGCEMFRDYMKIGEELWNWDHILKPISFYVGDLSEYEPKLLEPRVDFFKKYECQIHDECSQ